MAASTRTPCTWGVFIKTSVLTAARGKKTFSGRGPRGDGLELQLSAPDIYIVLDCRWSALMASNCFLCGPWTDSLQRGGTSTGSICVDPRYVATPTPPPPSPSPSPWLPPMTLQSWEDLNRQRAESNALLVDMEAAEAAQIRQSSSAKDLPFVQSLQPTDDDPYGQASCFFGFRARSIPLGRPMIRCNASLPPSPPPPPPLPPQPMRPPTPPHPFSPPNVLQSFGIAECEELGPGFVQLLGTEADEPPAQHPPPLPPQYKRWEPESTAAPPPTVAAVAEAEAAQAWFTVQIVVDRWQAGVRLDMTLSGKQLRTLHVRNALLLVNGPEDRIPGNRIPEDPRPGSTELHVSVLLLPPTFGVEEWPYVYLHLQGKLTHWGATSCTTERPPTATPRPPPPPFAAVLSALPPPLPGLNTEYMSSRALLLSFSGLLSMGVWWLLRLLVSLLGGCSVDALREAIERGRSRRGAVSVATVDDVADIVSV